MKTIESSFLQGGEFLTIQEAADYIGVSVKTLRRWDQQGRLSPTRHPVNGYRYYKRADLEPLRLEYRVAEQDVAAGRGVFVEATPRIDGNRKLREPQIEAYRAARAHFASSNAHAIIQIPVGCGKSGLMAILPFGIARGRTLVITPNRTIRKSVFETLDVASPRCFWRRMDILDLKENVPAAAVLDGPGANIHDCLRSDFVVANIQQLASSADRWLPQFPPNFFDMILVDEGHHNVAPSWRKVFERFPNAKVISLTATPFRGDQKRVTGDVIYRYAFTRAMLAGYIKQVHASNVAPSEIYFTYRDDAYRHTLSEVLALREEEWFSRGVALSPECNRHIVEHSIAKLEFLRNGGMKHQIIAAACSVDHARQVAALYEERGLRASEIHSNMDEEDQARVLNKLRDGTLDCVVQVAMLGEGFDHPLLSIAAIFRPFRSLSPYIQFVGRVMRVIGNLPLNDPNNQAWAVSHVGLNNDARWADFRELDQADQEIFHKWVTEPATDAEQEEREREERPGEARRFDGGMNVTREVVGGVVNEAFLDVDDDEMLDHALDQVVPGVGLTLAQLGVTREQLRAQYLARQPPAEEPPAPEVPVSPQRRRQAARTRLAQRTKSVANRLLKDLRLARKGADIGRARKEYAGLPNDHVLNQLLNRAINDLLGVDSKQRGELAPEQLERAMSKLDWLGDRLRTQLADELGR